MKFNAALSIWLNRTEQNLIEKINQGNMPFLGGYLGFLDQKSRKYFRSEVLNKRKSLHIFLVGLERWPAVFATYLTIAVVEGYGKDSNAAVWPYIDKAIKSPLYSSGIKTNNNKETLWKSYRAACIKIGLPVLSRKSGSQYMVNEFLNQAGVPIEFIPNLVMRMIKYSRAYGLPEENDTHAVKQWRLGLLDNMSAMQKPVIRALETDDTDYFPQLFFRYSSQENQDVSNHLEKKFHNQLMEISERNDSVTKIFKVPEVVWRDENICIEIPASENDKWNISVEGITSSYIGLFDKQIITLVTEMPYHIKVSNLSNQIWNFKLWENDANNRFLLFNEQGSFVKSCSLADDVHHLEPGEYQVLSRFIPSGYDEYSIQEISSSPSIYSFTLKLLPSERTQLSKGPATVALQADSKPILTWNGSHLKGVRGNELFASENLSVQLQIPEELHGDTGDMFIRLNSSNANDEIKELPISIDHTNIIDIPLETVCSEWNAGLIRLTASVFRHGKNRTLVRHSIYLWNGLKTITSHHRFEFERYPKNININESDNIDISANYLTFKESNNRFFHSVFGLGGKKQISFTWVVPGTFLYLEEYTERGFVEKPIPKGSGVSVEEGSRKALKVFSDHSGILHFGKFSQKYNFSHSRYKRIPLLSLVDYITPETNTVYFQPEDCNESEILLHLSSPQFVSDFYMIQQTSSTYQVIFKLVELAEKIEVKALNILDGKTKIEQLTANNPEDILSSQKKLSFSNEKNSSGVATHILDISLPKWDSGAWLLSFKIKVGERWHSLSNERQDNFVAGFVLSVGNIVPIETMFSELKEFSEAELLACFNYTHVALLDCYSEASWNEIKWVKRLWYELGNNLSVSNRQTLVELLRLSTKHPDENTEAGWIPICSVNAHFLEMYTLSAKQYSQFPVRNHLFLRSLSLMGGFSNELTRYFIQGIFYQTAAAGFSNFIGMMGGEEPQDFNINIYKDALLEQNLSSRIRLLNQEDWQPNEGQYLGALHYLYALEKMKSKYHITLGSDIADNHIGNHWRRGQALRLLGKLSSYKIHDFVKGIPAHWVSGDRDQHLGLLNTEKENESPQEVENLKLMLSGLSLLAQICRWDSRSSGALERFKAKAKELIEVDSKQLELILSYLLFIGEDVFSFYLLLWEFVTKADENQSSEETNLLVVSI